jgi:hypothetical protein
MKSENSKGITDAPTPPQGKTHGHPQPAVTPPVAPKTVTDHEHGSTGKAVPASTSSEECDAEREGKPA